MYLEGNAPLSGAWGAPFRCTLPATDVHPDNHPFGASCVY